MENYLDELHELKKCYEKYSFEEVMKLNKLKYLCSDQKVKVITNLFGEDLLMSNLIKERINILHQREKEKIDKRREFLDNKFK
jgi:hypothetical protein